MSAQKQAQTQTTGERILLQGSDACVRGALAAGCRFYAGYPITPATEIMELMSRAMPKAGGVFIQMEDEIASLGATIGASLGGLKAMTATSGPGFSLMQEHISFAAMAEVPCVIVNVMRAGPSTGLPTMSSQGDVMQARWGAHGDHPMLVVAPSSAYEFFDLTVKAFNLAERYRSPVIVLADEVVAHTRESVILPPLETLEIEDRSKPTMPPEWYSPYRDPGTGIPQMAAYGEGYRFHVTGLMHDINGYPTERQDETEELMARLFNKVSKDFHLLQWYDSYYEDGAEVTVIAYGSVARSALRAVKLAREKGLPVGLLKLKMLWPFMRRTVMRYLASSRVVIVPEMNMGQLSREVKRVNQGACQIRTLNKVDGRMITPSEILTTIEEALA
ncbi:MAG: 2-oxoacid:acceptor oxidoreductase subunit alpha [Dehalococcoidia bacterium]|nr:MAG: 2-oxoacid:acceptor oxidoreductase subunit alpha [Dehalococcoidia bacterium]